MRDEQKHAIILICSGLIGVTSVSFPWSDGTSLLGVLAVNEVIKAFPETSLSFAASDLQIISVYSAFYMTLVASSFLLAIGLLQLRNHHHEYAWMRSLSIAVYAGAVFSALQFPAYPPQFERASFGFYLFVSIIIIITSVEYIYTEINIIRKIRRVL